jgi:hypothetical protein
VPHLTLAAEIGRHHPNLHPLLEIHTRLWHDLAWELGEFTRKADYRYLQEPKGREGVSWTRALALFVGWPGLFGADQAGMPPRLADSVPEDAQTAPREAIPEDAALIEQLRFANAKLQRRVEDLEAQLAADGQARARVEFQVLRLTADLKAMVARVEGVTAPEQPTGEAPAVAVPPTDRRGG